MAMTLGRVLAGEKLLHLAGEIQMGLLPKKFPLFPSASNADVYATIVPALEVGGDFYHYFLLDSNHLCFVIRDVSDKGIPAALFMAMTLTAFVVFAKDVGRTLPESIGLLNQYLCDNNQSQMFVTLYAGMVALRTGVLEYCDGGHEPPFLSTSSCELLCDAVMKRLGQFVHGAPQSDDITVLAVSYRGHAESECLERAKSA